jgi:hypothetical protein
MKTRIRYEKSPDNPNLLISKQIFQAENGVDGFHKHSFPLKVILDIEKMSYSLVTANTYTIVFSRENITKNLNILKMKAKNALIDLGVEFQEEKRNR